MPNTHNILLRWLVNLFGTDKGITFPRLDVECVANLDDIQVQPFRIYLETRAGKDRWLHLLCPCGCKDLLSVNLMQSHQPSWRVIRHHEDGCVSVVPSIDKIAGCQSHFYIIRNRIIPAHELFTTEDQETAPDPLPPSY